MRGYIVLLVLGTVCLLALAADNGKPIYDIAKAPQLFEKFIKDYNRHYKDAADKQTHYEAFVKSLNKINQINSEPNGTATFDINKFADYTEAEMNLNFGHKKNGTSSS